MKISSRLFLLLPTLFFISFLSFLLLEARAGNFLSTLEFASASQEHITQNLSNVDMPVLQKYFLWLSHLIFQQSWGESFLYRQPVFGLVTQHLSTTLILTLLITICKWGIAFPIALFASKNPQHSLSKFLLFTSHISLSFPEFLTAILLLWLAIVYPFLMNYLFLLAILVGTFHTSGILFQLLFTRFYEIQKEPFYRQLQIQGMSSHIQKRHLMRHAWPQILLIFSNDIPALFSGGLIVSIIFNLPTLGPFFQQSILSHDTNLTMGIVMFLAIFMQLGYLIADIMLHVFLLPLKRSMPE